MKSFFYTMLILLRNIAVLLVFLALTFILLESIKYYQRVEKEKAEVKAIIAIDDYAVPQALEEISQEEEVFDTIFQGVDILTAAGNAEASTINDKILEDVAEVTEQIVASEEIKNDIENKPEEVEVVTDVLPSISEEVRTEIQEPEQESNNIVDEEGSYNLYEEDLPHNIIVESGIHKDIKEIKVEPTQKPPYFETPLVAIVIDDMGINKKRTKDISSLNFPLTSSYLTYADDLKVQIESSKKSGHEIIAHIPMEAKSNVNTAPDVLTVAMNDEDVISNLNKMIDKFDDINGINNHMGSKFTENKEKMYDVMEVLGERNLFFLDSRTSNKSAAKDAADKFNVSYANRNIFLDNENDLAYIVGQLRATEKVAVKKGYAIAIGHPKSQTYLALKQWLPEVEKRGLKVVHLSEIIGILNKNKEISDKQ